MVIGMFAYMERHNTQMLVFENSDTLDEETSEQSKDQTYLDSIMQEVKSMGLVPIPVLCDALLFGCPQSRRRWYIVAAKTVAAIHFNFGLRPCADVFQLFTQRLPRCVRRAPCAKDVLYDNDDPRVEKQLNIRLQKGRQNQRYNAGDVANTFKEHRMRYGDSKVPSDIQESPWFGTLSNLSQNVLCLSVLSYPPSEVLAHDVSQSIRRCRTSKMMDGFGISSAAGKMQHVMFAMMPEQQVFLTLDGGPHRMLLGEECMMIQGFPIAKVEKLVNNTDQHTMMQLGGNMMATPVLLGLMVSFFESVLWQDSVETASQEDADSALMLFCASTGAEGEDEEEMPEPSGSSGSPLTKRRRS